MPKAQKPCERKLNGKSIGQRDGELYIDSVLDGLIPGWMIKRPSIHYATLWIENVYELCANSWIGKLKRRAQYEFNFSKTFVSIGGLT